MKGYYFLKNSFRAFASNQMSNKVKIYTKPGDTGRTSLFSGERKLKSDPFFDALGNTDELNACLGIVRSIQAIQHCSAHEDVVQKLRFIQSRLIDLGSSIATPKTTSPEEKLRIAHFDEAHTAQLESWIDEYEDALPPLRLFILPSGGLASSHLHLARAVCRRAERSIVPFLKTDDLEPAAYRFVNRLSDFLFVVARTVCHREGQEEIPYKKERPPEPAEEPVKS